MSLATLTARFFDRYIRERGESLYAARKVHEDHAGPNSFVGRVQGGDLYDVEIHQNGRLLDAWCDCRYFQDQGVCKHLWAAIMQSDRCGALTAVRQVDQIEMLDVDIDVDEGLENYDDPEFSAPRMPPEHIPQLPPWQDYLEQVEYSLAENGRRAGGTKPRQIVYCIDVASSASSRKLVIELFSRTQKKNGEWSEEKEINISPDEAARLTDPADVEIVSLLVGAQDPYGYYPAVRRKMVMLPLALKLLPQMSACGRLYARDSLMEPAPAKWDEGEPWAPWLEIRQDDRDQWTIAGFLRRGEDRMPFAEPRLMLPDGLMLARGKVARFDPAAYGWVHQLRRVGRIPFPDRDRDAVLAKLLELPATPPMEVDDALKFEVRETPPRLGLRIGPDNSTSAPRYAAQFMVDYGQGWLDGMSKGRGIWRPQERVYLQRDQGAEQSAREKLSALGMRQDPYRPDFWVFAPKVLPRAARELIATGWRVEAEGKTFRSPGATRVSVKSGIDWFELHGEVDYGDTTASLPDLLAAIRRGDSMVVLGDGTFGLLPEDWLERFGTLAGMGEATDGYLKFRRNQAWLLDAMLAAQPDVDLDAKFQHVRDHIRNFHGVRAIPQPEGFVGQLRQYQAEGVGWMEFLREFGFGGCLADDMGVGKTAQVLAALEARRVEGKGPSLVVAPKSVMFNWRQEAARFTPQLRVLEYHGLARDAAQIPEHDLVLTTYGTMLRDISTLSRIVFDYVVLDEAQAVKNASTASAKAVRLLSGAHRLALSGTPVENHLGELWSLFEFLNPGMLGEARVLQMAGGLARNPSEDVRKLLAQALRPFILRRTKQQVAPELPSKTEQTIFCELEGPQKKQYDDLRRHYQHSLLERVRSNGLAQSKMQVLEALLRLRQAACHPGLIDAKRVDESSAKLDTLLEQLAELRDEGHKALVFSQFTSLLSILRRRLDQQGVRYAYLDGATTDRQGCVETFQNDTGCGLFLISLKAGGLGLNLTAAEYVFLLDPWWNPAVEAQAVDRAHRIGQTKPVFAYRLIARNTVEEKVMQLQKTKRDLAEAILSEDNSLIRDLKSEDLELLLS